MATGSEAKPFYRGDRFEVIDEFRITALTHWRAPFTGGFETTVPKGLVVVALQDAHHDWRTYPGLPAEPEEYEAWEERLVPRADIARRDDPRGYDGFTLMFDVTDIESRLRRLPGMGRPRKPW